MRSEDASSVLYAYNHIAIRSQFFLLSRRYFNVLYHIFPKKSTHHIKTVFLSLVILVGSVLFVKLKLQKVVVFISQKLSENAVHDCHSPICFYLLRLFISSISDEYTYKDPKHMRGTLSILAAQIADRNASERSS